ncbi:MAG: serine protease [Pseudobdellovibrionaceae bacterium]
MIMLLFSCLFFISNLHAQNLLTSAVQNFQTGHVVGSSMQIRTTTNSRSPYQYLTAAHVVESTPRLAIAGMEMKTVFLDSAADFAILEPVSNRVNLLTFGIAPVELGNSISGPAEFFKNFRSQVMTVPSTFHLSEVLRRRQSVLLRVVGFDPRMNQSSERYFRSPLIQSNVSGIPAREEQGALLQFEGDLVPGASGSAVVAFVDSEGKLYDGQTDPCLPREIFCEWRPRLLGLITSIVPRAHSVSFIPVWTIIHRIENPNVHVSRRTRHFRNPQRGEAAGVQRGGDGGAPRGGDGGAIKGPRGAGHGNVWSSGLMILDDPSKRWFELKNLWTEHEPFHEALWERSGFPRIGFYEEGGRIYKSHPDANWPVWFSPQLPMSATPARMGLCQLMNSQKWRTRADGSPSAITGRLQIRICTLETEIEQKIRIEEIKGRTAELIMELKLSAGENNLINDFATDSRRELLTRMGLRTYENDNVRIEIDYSSGLNISLKGSREKIIGPVWSNFQ